MRLLVEAVVGSGRSYKDFELSKNKIRIKKGELAYVPEEGYWRKARFKGVQGMLINTRKRVRFFCLPTMSVFHDKRSLFFIPEKMMIGDPIIESLRFMPVPEEMVSGERLRNEKRMIVFADEGDEELRLKKQTPYCLSRYKDGSLILSEVKRYILNHEVGKIVSFIRSFPPVKIDKNGIEAYKEKGRIISAEEWRPIIEACYL